MSLSFTSALINVLRDECHDDLLASDDLPVTETIDGVIVDQATSLHEGITDGAADELEAALF